MTAALVAIDLPGGPGFVAELQRIWQYGNAAFPVDQRLPGDAKAAVCRAMRVGDPVERGDALVMATSGSTGTPKGVVLTHDAVAASAAATSTRIGVDRDGHRAIPGVDGGLGHAEPPGAERDGDGGADGAPSRAQQRNAGVLL